MKKIEEGFKNALSMDLYHWIMKFPHRTDISVHEYRANLTEFLAEKGWVKCE